MCNKNLKILSCMVLVTGALSGLAGCSCMPSKTIRTEEKTIASDVDDTTTEYYAEEQNQKMERGPDETGLDIGRGFEGLAGDDTGLGEMEIVNAAEFGNPKEVLDHMPIASNVTVIKTGEDELQIEFELENVGLCTFAAGKEEKSVLPDEVFVDSTKIEWTASTADGEYIFPYMKVNEGGDMFMIDWTYNGYDFAIYGKLPKDISDRDMAGKIALAIIYNLGEVDMGCKNE